MQTTIKDLAILINRLELYILIEKIRQPPSLSTLEELCGKLKVIEKGLSEKNEMLKQELQNGSRKERVLRKLPKTSR